MHKLEWFFLKFPTTILPVSNQCVRRCEFARTWRTTRTCSPTGSSRTSLLSSGLSSHPHQCQYRPFCDKTNLSYIPTLSEIPSSGALKLVWGKQPFTQRWRQDSLMIALSTSTSDPDICRTCTRLWKCWDLTQLSRRSLKRRSSLKETGILEINFCTGGGHSKWDS